MNRRQTWSCDSRRRAGGLCPCRHLAQESAFADRFGRQPAARERPEAGRQVRAGLLDPRAVRGRALPTRWVDIVNLSGRTRSTRPGIAAAKAGKHILMEKPMPFRWARTRPARGGGQGRRAERGELRAAMEPTVREPQELLATGAVGKLFYVEVDYWHGLAQWWTAGEWAHKTVKRGSTISWAGATRWTPFAGSPAARSSRSRPSPTTSKNFEYDAMWWRSYKFDDGSIGKTSPCSMPTCPTPSTLTWRAPKEPCATPASGPRRSSPAKKSWTTMQTILPDSGAVEHHPFDAQINHFVDCIREGRESHCNIADAYRPTKCASPSTARSPPAASR